MLLILTLPWAGISGCTDAKDEDGDGYDFSEDCDDSDPLRNPGLEEICDGIDNDCEPTTWAEGEGHDFDGDGSPACVDCDDQAPSVYPGAEPICQGLDADCDGELDSEGDALGSNSACAALDCAQLLETRPEAVDGTYWIHAGDPSRSFEVACDMTTDGGGWVHLALDDADGVIVGSRSEDNPWHKCDDDAASFYVDLTESEIESDYFANGLIEVPLAYSHPATGELIDPLGIAALGRRVSELHPSSRMVATIGDNDGADWPGGSNGGLEVYIVTATGDWLLLTPGAGGNCGGGTWPSAGSETGFYLWGSSSQDAELAGDTGLEDADWALEEGQVLPVAVQLAVFTGGGVSFGFEGRSFRVR
jgi:hypothetical protein